METRRFHALDGLRGICAVLVLLYHTFLHQPSHLFGHGYLSVDVFFVLSGFVLAYAFGDRLASGMRPMEFMRARIRRLGPIVWFAAGFSVVGCLVTQALGGPAVPFPVLLLAGMFSLFLLPMVSTSGIDAFPLDGPLWSLFAEFWVNAGFALLATRLKLSVLAAIIAVGWLLMIATALMTGTTDFGAAQSSVLYSLLRAAPGFACGVLIFKLWRSGALAKLPSVHPLLVFAAWVAVSLAPDLGPAFDLAQTIIAAPLIVALLARSTSAAPRWTQWLGRISYPLYATHVVVINAGLRLAHGVLPAWELVALPALAIALAAALAHWYEPALRTAKTRFAGAVAQNAIA